MYVLRALDADPDHGLSLRLMPGAVKTVGRDRAADYRVDLPLVSRLHCRLEVGMNGTVEVVDLDSTNGTWVDGEKVARAPIEPGSTLRVGRVAFVLERAV